MLKIERILCPVDFSEFSARAYDYAHSLARHYGATLFVLHVVRAITIDPTFLTTTMIDQVYSQQAADAKAQIAKLAEKQAGEAVQTQVAVQMGLVADSILSFAKDRDADLIIIGTHGRRGLDRVLMGSTTEAILRKAHCPVLAVREPVRSFVRPESPDDPVHIQKLLCCVDFSEHSPRALEYAFSLGQQYNAEVALLHVIEDGKGAPGESEQAMGSMEQLVPDEVRDWASVVPVVRSGRSYEAIIEYASEAGTDLIVMGVRGRNVVDLAVFGSTTHRVIQLGPCPVLVVRA
ncbi:MAG TPA: universal stress protein [Acidobacteriaceae bacterium]|nr:universal stress protein [Acidobacteriaceae bacterium]